MSSCILPPGKNFYIYWVQKLIISRFFSLRKESTSLLIRMRNYLPYALIRSIFFYEDNLLCWVKSLKRWLIFQLSLKRRTELMDWKEQKWNTFKWKWSKVYKIKKNSLKKYVEIFNKYYNISGYPIQMYKWIPSRTTGWHWNTATGSGKISLKGKFKVLF